VPHYARAGVALLSGGKGYGEDEKDVEVGDNVIVDTAIKGTVSLNVGNSWPVTTQ